MTGGGEDRGLHPEYWRQFPEFEVPDVLPLRDTDDSSERVRIVVGSDLVLTLYAVASEGVVVACRTGMTGTCATSDVLVPWLKHVPSYRSSSTSLAASAPTGY